MAALGMIDCKFLINPNIFLFYLRCTEYVHQNLILDLKTNLRHFGIGQGKRGYH